MGQDAIRLQVASAIDVVVHVERTESGRQVASVGIMEVQDSGLVVAAALEIQQRELRFGGAWPLLARRLGLDPGLAGADPSELQAAPPAGRPPGPGRESLQPWPRR
jgi:pilus assembly protein CpaF